MPTKSNARSAITWTEGRLRITRFPSITHQQFLGCVAAFVDSLTGELNASAAALRRLEGQAKGAAFAYEMALDTHRYGALIVLDRWSTLNRAFGEHVDLELAKDVPTRVAAAENILVRANQLLDAADRYSDAIVEACLMAFQSVTAAFDQERKTAEQSAKLGPMLSEEYTSARRIFLEDLAAR